MSKRFGRNQKRRMRADLALAQTKITILTDNVQAHQRNASVQQDRVRSIIREIERICEYSSALPPKVHEARKKDTYRVGIRPKPKPNLAALTMQDCITSVPDDFMQTVDCHLLEIYLEQNIEAMQLAVHLNCTTGKHSAYMISEAALKSISEEELVKNLMPDVVRQLIIHLRS